MDVEVVEAVGVWTHQTDSHYFVLVVHVDVGSDMLDIFTLSEMPW